MKALPLLLVIVVLIAVPAAAYDVLGQCLAPYEPLTLLAIFPNDGDVASRAYLTADNQLIHTYVNQVTGETWLIVDGQRHDCLSPEHAGDLPTITLYPLNGERFTWSVQDDFDHWHTVRLLTGETAQTTVEYDDSGRAFTRLVVRRNQPLDASRYHIFDENGNIAG